MTSISVLYHTVGLESRLMSQKSVQRNLSRGLYTWDRFEFVLWNRFRGGRGGGGGGGESVRKDGGQMLNRLQQEPRARIRRNIRLLEFGTKVFFRQKMDCLIWQTFIAFVCKISVRRNDIIFVKHTPLCKIIQFF